MAFPSGGGAHLQPTKNRTERPEMNDPADPLNAWYDPTTVLDTPEPSILEAMLEAARLSTVALMKTPTQTTPGVPGCWLGGAPTLPPEIAWPWVQDAPTPDSLRDLFQRTGRPIRTEYSLRNPMNFMSQIDLEQVPRTDKMPDLPSSGTLFFFADYVTHVDRFDDNPMYRVIYFAGDVSAYPPRKQPEFPADFEALESSYWWADEPGTAFEEWPVTFHMFETWDTPRFPNRTFQEAALSQSVAARDQVRRRAHKDQKLSDPPAPGRKRGDYQDHCLMGGA